MAGRPSTPASQALDAVQGDTDALEATVAALTTAVDELEGFVTDLLTVVGDQASLDPTASPTFVNLHLTGGLRTSTRLISATTSLTVADRFVEVNTTGGAVTLTLPPVADVAGQDLIIKRINGANNLVIDPNGTEQLDGSSTSVTVSDNNVRRYWSTGGQWRSW